MRFPACTLGLFGALSLLGCGGKADLDDQDDPLTKDPIEKDPSADDTQTTADDTPDKEDPPVTDDTPDTDAKQQMICDGSDDTRFVFVQGGGFVGPEYVFTGAYGSRFLVIDGQCNYWLGSEGMAGLRAGQLELEEGAALSEALQYGKYASAADYRSLPCPDAGGTSLFDGTTRLVSGCAGSDQDAPAVWSKAFTAIFQEWQTLDKRATPAWGPTSLLVVESQDQRTDSVPWDVDLELKPLAITFDDLIAAQAKDLGTLIEDEQTLEQLGQFRTAALSANEYANSVAVEESGVTYQVYVRDELPKQVANAITEQSN